MHHTKADEARASDCHDYAKYLLCVRAGDTMMFSKAERCAMSKVNMYARAYSLPCNHLHAFTTSGTLEPLTAILTAPRRRFSKWHKNLLGGRTLRVTKLTEWGSHVTRHSHIHLLLLVASAKELLAPSRVARRANCTKLLLH